MEPRWFKSYPPGVPEHVDIPDAPLTKLLDDSVARFPDSPAIYFEGSRMTYRQLGAAVDKFASGLAKLGVKKGTRVGFILPNLPQNVIAYYATLRLGGTVIENNPQYTERELTHQLEDAGVEVVITLDRFYDVLAKVRPHVPALREVIVTTVFDGVGGIKGFLGPILKKELLHPIPSGAQVRKWKDVMRSGDGRVQQAQIDPRVDLALLQYTGGTTGLSKGVMLTHHNLVANVYQGRAWFAKAELGKEVAMVALPIFHSYGQTVCMNLGIMLAGMLVLVPDPRDMTHLLKVVNETRPTLFPGVPTLYINMLNHPNLSKTDMTSIKFCFSGAAPLPLEVQEQFEAVTGGVLVEGYGLSETAPISHGNPLEGKRKIGTIGLPVPNTECKLVDVDDPSKEVEPPGPGELCIRGPQVMQGYWNKPEETAEVLRDGWLYTGDIAEMDEDGFFKIVDRKKDMIIVGGFNVYPRDVEEILYQHPKVRECAVVGIPGGKSGETVKAYIVLKEGETLSAEEIESFSRERLTAYKVPKLWEFRDDLPKTMVGKVLRRALLEEEKAKASK